MWIWLFFFFGFIKEGLLKGIRASHRIQGKGSNWPHKGLGPCQLIRSLCCHLSGLLALLCAFSARLACEPTQQLERGPSELTTTQPQLLSLLRLLSHEPLICDPKDNNDWPKWTEFKSLISRSVIGNFELHYSSLFRTPHSVLLSPWYKTHGNAWMQGKVLPKRSHPNRSSKIPGTTVYGCSFWSSNQCIGLFFN